MRFFKLIIVSLIAFGPFRAANAAHQIEGYWLNTRNHVGIDIEETSHGIRVRRTDQNKWYQYDRIRVDQYRDSQGNTYYQFDNDELEWESYDGRRRIKFRRSHRDERYGHDYRDRYHDDSPGTYHIYKQLSGRWINESTGLRIQIKEKRNRLKVKTRGKWRDFRQTRGGDFIDQRGNRYRIRQGWLEYVSHHGDLVMRFKKY